MRLWRDMENWGMNHDITPPSKVQCPNAQCWLRVRSLWVGAVEFGNKLLGALYITDRAPFVFFNTIALPVYYVLSLSVKYLAVKDLFEFVLFDAIMNDEGWWRWVAFLMFGNRVTLEGT